LGAENLPPAVRENIDKFAVFSETDSVATINLQNKDPTAREQLGFVIH
jgi:hypothetical protein